MKCLRLRNAILLGSTMGEVYVSSLPLAIDLVNVCDDQITIEHPLRYKAMMDEWSPKEMKLELHKGGSYMVQFLSEALCDDNARGRSFLLVLRECRDHA